MRTNYENGQILAGVVFASTDNFWGLLLAGIVGVISTSGGECGPFIAVEQVGRGDHQPGLHF